MDKDIVTRLRCCSPFSEDGTINSNMWLIAKAANEITTLREQLRDREAEILRLRTTETASAHALDTVRQAMGICLDPSETPSTIAARIVARFDEVGERGERYSEQLRVAREGLEWYSQPDNWRATDIEVGECMDTGAPRSLFTSFTTLDRGQRARDTLARIDAMKEDDNA